MVWTQSLSMADRMSSVGVNEDDGVTREKSINKELASKLDNEAFTGGVHGTYLTVNNDFSPNQPVYSVSHYKPDVVGTKSHEKEGKLRHLVCTICLMCIATATLSRMVLNVSIVDMLQVEDASKMAIPSEVSASYEPDFNPLDIGEAGKESSNQVSTVDLPSLIDRDGSGAQLSEDTTESLNEVSGESHSLMKAQNLVLSAFFFGYMPSLLICGNLAEKYGSRIPIFIALSMTSVLYGLTPLISRFSIPCLVASRVVLGLFQGSLIPSTYDLFNKWLTPTEMSIYAPMVKTAFGVGGLIGTFLPGFVEILGYTWVASFYLTSAIAAICAGTWIVLSTSSPRTNIHVNSTELKRIERKKASPPPTTTRAPTPWFRILTNPSVIALTLVKFTFNCGLDFFAVELPIYLRNIHDAPTKVISLIISGGCLIHVLFLGLVCWAAKEAVGKQYLGFNKTTWRKIFQGIANFGMAFAYLCLPFVSHDRILIGSMFLIVVIAYMFGAGGESMLPYDLSERYPATIMGLAHSISITSGIAVTQLSSFVIKDSPENPDKWDLVFTILGFALLFGGLVFTLVAKAEPFLPEERKGAVGEKIQT